MNLFTLMATLGLDTSEFSKNIGSAVNQGKNAGAAIAKAASFVAKTTGAIVVTASTAFAGVVKTAADKVADLEQNVGGAVAVWGDALARQQQKIAQQAYKNTGLTTSQYMEMSNKMGSLLQGMGFESRDAFATTTNAMQRAADVASVMNLPIEQAMEAINGMAKGNFTMMDNLGVAMNETTLSAYALEKGIDKPFRKMSQQDKIALAYQMFFEKTAHTVGNFSKELEGLAGASVSLKASWINLLDGSGTPEDFADQLVNYVDTYMNLLSNVAPRIWESLKIVASNLGNRITEWVSAQGGWGQALLVPVNWALGELGLPDAETIVNNLSTWWTENTMYDKLKGVAKWAIGEIDLSGVSWKTIAEKLIDNNVVAQAFKGAEFMITDWILPVGSDLATGISNWWGEFTTSFNQTAQLIWTGFGLPEWSDIETKVNTWWTSIKTKLSEIFHINIGVGFSFGGGETPEQQQYGEQTTNQVEAAGGFADGTWNPGFNEPGYSTPRSGATNIVNQYISAAAQTPADVAFATQQALNRLRFG